MQINTSKNIKGLTNIRTLRGTPATKVRLQILM